MTDYAQTHIQVMPDEKVVVIDGKRAACGEDFPNDPALISMHWNPAQPSLPGHVHRHDGSGAYRFTDFAPLAPYVAAWEKHKDDQPAGASV